MSHKDFPKLIKDSHRFAKEFYTVIQLINLVALIYISLVYMLNYEGQTQHWMKTIIGKILTGL